MVCVSHYEKAWIVENDVVKIFLNAERCWFDILEKKSGTQWLHDPWADTVGELILKRKAKEKRSPSKITVDLSASEEKSVSGTVNGLRVQLSRFKVDGKNVGGSLTFELLIPEDSEHRVKVKVTNFQLMDPQYTPKQLHFPCRAFSLKTAGDRGYLVAPCIQGCILPRARRLFRRLNRLFPDRPMVPMKFPSVLS